MEMAEDRLITLLAARSEVLGVLVAEHDNLAARAARLYEAVSGVGRLLERAEDPTSVVWDCWRVGVEALVSLLRWDAAVEATEADADRYRDAAIRNALVAQERLAALDRIVAPGLDEALSAVVGVRDVRDLQVVEELVARAALPLPALSPRLRWSGPDVNQEVSSSPKAVCLLRVDGTPVTDAFVVEPGRLHEIETTVRVVDVPDWAESIELEFLSRLPPTVVTVPDRMTFETPDVDEDGLRTSSGVGAFVIQTPQKFGAKPLAFPVVVRLTSDSREEVIPVFGFAKFLVRTFDASRDVLAGQPQLDERVAGMFGELQSRADIPISDREAFFRFFGAVVKAALQIQIGRAFRPGDDPREAAFQRAMLDRLNLDSAVVGRVQSGTGAAGGSVDLIHERIVCELKVERSQPVTLESAARYLGQPVHYASGTGSPLSILCILDMTVKDAPVGTFTNYIGWLKPSLHGLEAPDYPSLVGVVIINGNLPLPSEWAHRRVAAEVEGGTPSDDEGTSELATSGD